MKREVALCLQVGQPVLLGGEPGTAKTSVVRAIDTVLGRVHRTIGMPQRHDPGDFAFPYLDTEAKCVRKSPCVEIADLVRECGDGTPGTLFLDEIFDTSRASQSLAMRLINEGRIDDVVLPPSVTVIAAGNPAACNATGQGLPRALQNRLLHINVGTGTDTAADWADAAVSGFNSVGALPRVPAEWRDHLPDAATRIAAFIRAKPALLHAMPKDDETMAWPSRRSWHMLMTVLAGCRAAGCDDILPTLAAGLVGDGAAMEFIVYEREMDLPDPETILVDPTKLDLHGRQDIIFAVANSVVSVVSSKPELSTQARWNAAWKVLAHMASGGCADVAAAPATRLIGVRKTGWALPNAELKAFAPLLRKAGLIGGK